MYTPGLILDGTRTQCPFDFFYVFTKNFMCACCLGGFHFQIALNLLKHAYSYCKYAVFFKNMPCISGNGLTFHYSLTFTGRSLVSQSSFAIDKWRIFNLIFYGIFHISHGFVCKKLSLQLFQTQQIKPHNKKR